MCNVITATAHLRMYIEEIQFQRAGGRKVAPKLDLSELGLLGENPDGEDLLVEWSGRAFVCPRNTRIRMLEGVLAFYNAYASAGSSLIVPERVAQRAAEELVRLTKAGPAAKSHILTTAWFIPLRWFVPFAPEEREVLGGEDVSGIRYRTSAVGARKRLQRALKALRLSGLDDNVVQQVDDLAEWVAGFPRGSMLELDYGTVAALFSAPDLVLDETAADVWASIAALERGDVEEAGEHYGAAASRWATAIAVTFSN